MGSLCQRQYDPRRAMETGGADFGQLQHLQDGQSPGYLNRDGMHGDKITSARDPNFDQDRGTFGDGRCCLLLMMGSFLLFLLTCAGLILAPSLLDVVRRGEASSSYLRTAQRGDSNEQPTRLRITNGCNHEALWLARLGKDQVDGQNIKIWPLESHDVSIPENTLGTTRFWPKWRCVKDGNACAVGDSGGPGLECDARAGCSPPMDTKFEATFGEMGLPCNTSEQKYEGCDFVDVSVKDGFTVPFQLQIKGDCKGSYSRNTDKVHQIVDCTKLSVDECPSSETIQGSQVDLRAINPSWGAVSGCLSPCSQMTFPKWQDGTGAQTGRVPRSEVGPEASPYCCPTPQACQDGEMTRTQYVAAVHRMCPGVNSYPYDHGMGVGTCPAGTKYEIVFYCPRTVVTPTSTNR